MPNEFEKLLKIAVETTRIPQEELLKLIRSDFKDGVLPKFMKLANVQFASNVIEEIQHDLKEDLDGLRKDLRKRTEDTIRIILYNLVKCTFTRERLSLPGSKEAYEGESYYRKLYFTRRSVVSALKILRPYLSKYSGNTYENRVNSYAPSELLQLKLIPLLYFVYEEYKDDTNLIVIQDSHNQEFDNILYSKRDLDEYKQDNNKHIMRVRSSIFLERTFIQDLEQLVKVNEALKDATYALKAPIKRIYSRGTTMMGGRLYTPLANLPDKKTRIRINTFFNGNPVAEVDLKANHSSMLYALKNKQLPRDFYQIIADNSGQPKDKVKWLIMKMIGAKNRAISLTQKISDLDFYDSKFVMTQEEKHSIESTVQSLYPELYDAFYKDMGVVLQSLEGDILLDAICDLVDQGILSLPIHDALYVEQQNISVAETALKKAWRKNLDVNFEPFIDIDMA